MAKHDEADYLSPEQERTLGHLRHFADWTDDAYRIPFTNVRIGLEAIVGLIPGVGDAAGLFLALYVPYTAWQLGVPGRVLGRMGFNVVTDALLGTVPLLGDLFDVVWRANKRNVSLLEAHLRAQQADAPDR